MLKMLKRFNTSTAQTKYFILNWVVYGLAILVTAVYCYGRLDFVRSYRTPAAVETKQPPAPLNNNP